MKEAELIPSDDVRLRQRASPVKAVNRNTRLHFTRLMFLMDKLNGLGIAAPQIGVMQRLCLVRDRYGQHIYMANPVIVEASAEMQAIEEGCLSFPGVALYVPRHARITVRFLGYGNRPEKVTLTGIPAVCAQHEIDHLDGVVFNMRAADANP